jgi:hypothetical protein
VQGERRRKMKEGVKGVGLVGDTGVDVFFEEGAGVGGEGVRCFVDEKAREALGEVVLLAEESGKGDVSGTFVV